MELGEEARQEALARLLHLHVAVRHPFLVHLGDDLVDGLELPRSLEQ